MFLIVIVVAFFSLSVLYLICLCVCVQVGGDRGQVEKQRKSSRRPASYSRAQRAGLRKRSFGEKAGGAYAVQLLGEALSLVQSLRDCRNS